MRRPAICLALGVAVAALSCRSRPETRPLREPPPPGVQATVIDYADEDAFDGVFEVALVNQNPVITIRTENDKPNWQGRLNAWIAAWNMGGKVEPRVVRGQVPIPTVQGDTLREFRLLVDSFIDHAEDLGKAGASWWQDARTRSHRVALLKPYNLRFHVGDEGRIQLIFFNGNYSDQYQDFMAKLMDSGEEARWSRTVECSYCKRFQEAMQARQTFILTGG